VSYEVQPTSTQEHAKKIMRKAWSPEILQSAYQAAVNPLKQL
jgi:hypothetical protein